MRRESSWVLGNLTTCEESNFRPAKLIEKADEYRCLFWNNVITRKYGYFPGLVSFPLKGKRRKKARGSYKNNLKRVKYLWLIFKRYVSNSDSFVWFTLKQNFNSSSLIHSRCFNVFLKWLASTFNLLPLVLNVIKINSISSLREPVSFQVCHRIGKILPRGKFPGALQPSILMQLVPWVIRVSKKEVQVNSGLNLCPEGKKSRGRVALCRFEGLEPWDSSFGRMYPAALTQTP